MTKDGIMQLRSAIGTIEKRQQFLDTRILTEAEDARKCIHMKNRKGAMLHLKRKKIYENSIEKLFATSMALESQINTLEQANVTKEMVSAMQSGTEALKNAIGITSVENVDKIMDDISESMDVSNELQDAIARPLGEPIDEDELTKELDDLTEEQMSNTLLEPPQLKQFPEIPISNPPISNPPISNPPISNPPISNPPIPVQTATADETEMQKLQESLS